MPHQSQSQQPPDNFNPPIPAKSGERLQWGQLYAGSAALTIAAAARNFAGLTTVVVEDIQAATRLEDELRFFLSGDNLPVLSFPDWETLPYDIFSPLPELVSERLLTLNRLPSLERGVLVVPIGTLLQRLPPRSYIEGNSLLLQVGDRLPLQKIRQRMERAGYRTVSQVLAHGEMAVRGSLFDIFPMGSEQPYRIDLLDEEIESIRTFSAESQRTLEQIPAVELLPAREFPLDEGGINHFNQAWRSSFEGNPQNSMIFREVMAGNAPGGLEYYLPLFFEETSTLFDFLPSELLLLRFDECLDQVELFLQQLQERYQERKDDIERPILPPSSVYLERDELASHLNRGKSVLLQGPKIRSRRKGYSSYHNFNTKALPALSFQARAPAPAAALLEFLATTLGRVLFVAESAGRRELLLDTLGGYAIHPTVVADWREFLDSEIQLALTVAPLEQGVWLPHQGITIITESQLLGERVRQERRRHNRQRESEQTIRNLTELHPGAPVVHEDHGVGRYLGLQTLDVGDIVTEFLALEYAQGDKLYVPVSSLHLISRYSGAAPENAPLHKLGGEQWERLKRKAAKQVHDVAAELLDIHARRAANKGYAFPSPGEEYNAFAAAFEFEETPDQQQAIDAVLADMHSPNPMDRLVCGDVGFGKTEVAMRAAFMSIQGGKQVAVLVPTTLLAQQHYQNFADRFADWPTQVEGLSRFRSSKEQKRIIQGLSDGSIDIIIGTHRLLQDDIRFKRLGLVIIDEEQRFGVRHKEKLKGLRSEVDLLTLTATPIPRTLNMALSGMRDLSLIATPPVARHPIKTFISPWEDALIVEACQREIKRGGQVYILHNEVSTIENMAEKVRQLLPGSRTTIAHGQMRERELEDVMRDFYHQRFNILVCSTIIESGIDVPSANTIIINRADKLGLAQLHQLRGRVGRSHHRAYAYLLTPSEKRLTPDAKKRLEAIESMEDLGAGFTLATNDLEIRGAGELLGAGQSGQIHAIGFSLYSELLERAVAALKAGEQPRLDRPLDHGAEIDMQLPALLPEDYIQDVHTRLVLYKRIASAESSEELRELQVEMIDRFGLLPEPAKSLFAVTELKLRIRPLGISKLEAGPESGRITFEGEPKIDPANLIRLIQTRPTEFKLDGTEKIRFFRDMSDRSRRIEQVSSIIGEISG